jgi:pimeloyl-ACP methyl ester carboxylesterase
VGIFGEKPVFIHTVICGSRNNPVLVLVHGYGGSGALFFKIIKQICKYFCLIFVDIIGMGSSSRPLDFKYNEFSELDCE